VPPDQPGLTLDAQRATEETRTPDPRPRRRLVSPAAERRPRERRPKIIARRVRRVVRRLDPWSVLKVSLVFYVCCYIVTMVAGILLWNLGHVVVEKVESFIEDYGSFELFEFDADQILEASLLLGGVLVVVATGLTVLAAVLFNLISDLVGGIRVVVLEEESARPAPARGDSVPGSPEPGAIAQSVRAHR
jgi:hypothetical protein